MMLIWLRASREDCPGPLAFITDTLESRQAVDLSNLASVYAFRNNGPNSEINLGRKMIQL
jgi:hypothetical protein